MHLATNEHYFISPRPVCDRPLCTNLVGAGPKRTIMSSPDQKEMQKRLRKLMKLPENQLCCDCGDKKPTWASLVVAPPEISTAGNMGAFCCFHCSGAHRRLGVHICFVRSLTLDDCKYFLTRCCLDVWRLVVKDATHQPIISS